MKFLIVLLFFIINNVYSQQIPVSYVFYERIKSNSILTKQDSFVHTGWFPYVFLNKYFDSLLTINQMDLKLNNYNFFERYYNRSFFYTKENDFILHINPIIEFEFTKKNVQPYTENTRGIIVSGFLSEKFHFVSGVTETQAFYPDYIMRYRTTNSVLPGSGRVRTFKQNGYDFSKSFGHIIYLPSKNLHFLLGHTRQFVGYGYRSLLLSDAPLEFPVFQFRFLYKRLQYICSYATFQSATAYDDRTKVFSRKYSSMHYLSYLINKNFEIAVFENTLFQQMSLQKNRPPEEYFSPVIFSHALMYGLKHRRNVLLGIQSQWTLFRFIQLYGQFALDDYSRLDTLRKKIAWQYGIKFSEPFGIKNLFFLLEHNKALPYVYSSFFEYSEFSQHNEPIAHVLGNRFNEYVIAANYRYKFWFANIKINNATYCENEKRLRVTNTSIINNIINLKVETGFVLNKPSKLNLVIGMHQRKSDRPEFFKYYYLAIRTNFFNFYDDF